MENIYAILEELRLNAEKSGEEIKTREIIKKYMGEFKGFREEQLGNSLIYSNIQADTGKVVAIRGDFDAVLTDDGTYEHRCGHHGHTAILLELAAKISQSNIKNIILIFQSAEETGAGAPELIKEGLFEKYKPDIILGCHNLPGYRENNVIIKKGNFNNSVIGFKCILNGKPTHAANPEQGITPAYALGKLISKLETMGAGNAKVSITHIKLGEHQYGTAAGNAIILGTIRSLDDILINNIIEELSELLSSLGKEYSLEVKLETSEYFKGIINDEEITQRLQKICVSRNYPVEEMQDIFRAGEDFGFYLDHVKGCYFGIGAGEKHPDLHTKDYFFNINNIKYTAQLLFDIIGDM